MADVHEPLRNLVLPPGVLDRDAARRSQDDLVARLLGEQTTFVVEFHGDRGEVLDTPAGVRLVARRATAQDQAWVDGGGLALYVGRVQDEAVLALLHPATEQGNDSRSTLRQVGLALPEVDSAVFLTALALTQWHARHAHCPRCGAATGPGQAGWIRVCEQDASEHFPRTDPAVIMAVVDGDDRILLARGARWDGPHRSVLAGFVEPGETFEQAVARETFEESGVVVDEITYLGNQPWPFPASLMIGFLARARTVELTPQIGEIEEIAWYSRADIDAGLADGSLRLPGHLSIARRLVEHWYGGPVVGGDFS